MNTEKPTNLMTRRVFVGTRYGIPRVKERLAKEFKYLVIQSICSIGDNIWTAVIVCEKESLK